MIGRDALAEGAELFNRGEWFEAHEVWELLWRSLPAGPDKRFVQGLIQLAVCLEHARRGNPRGSAGQWAKACEKLAVLPAVYGEVEIQRLLRDVDAVRHAVTSLPQLRWA